MIYISWSVCRLLAPFQKEAAYLVCCYKAICEALHNWEMLQCYKAAPDRKIGCHSAHTKHLTQATTGEKKEGKYYKLPTQSHIELYFTRNIARSVFGRPDQKVVCLVLRQHSMDRNFRKTGKSPQIQSSSRRTTIAVKLKHGTK